MGSHTFRREERLKKEKSIKELFNKGSSFNLYPFKIIFQRDSEPGNGPTKVLFSVPARNFKKAVDRNKIRRRTREAYRLNKNLLKVDVPYLLAFIYTAKAIEKYSVIDESIKKVFKKL